MPARDCRRAAAVLVETLLDGGVDTVFGLPGDGINGLVEALRIRQQRIRFIQARHEQAAGGPGGLRPVRGDRGPRLPQPERDDLEDAVSQKKEQIREAASEAGS